MRFRRARSSSDGDLARYADVIDGRHVDQEAAGQGDVRGDAGALLSQRFFGDLDDDLLPLAQQVGDGGRGRLVAHVPDAPRVRCCRFRRGVLPGAAGPDGDLPGPPRPPLRRIRREMRCM